MKLRTIPRRLPRLVAIALAFALLLWCGVSLVRLSIYKRFSLDEFAYAHAAWLVSKGKIPHRDFFEFHFPLLYLISSRLVGDTLLGLIRVRVFMLVGLAFTGYGMYRINRGLGPLLALAGPVIAATSPPFVFFATEIRPDALAFSLFLVSLSLLFPTPAGPSRAFLSGALLMLALFATQKAVIYASPLLVGVMLDTCRRKGRQPPLVPHRYWFFGAGTVGLCIACYFIVSRSSVDWFDQTLVWARYHERRYPGFSWTRYGFIAGAQAPVLVLLGVAGAGRSGISLRSMHRRAIHAEGLLLICLGSTLFSFWFARAPFPYALLPGLGMLAVFAPRGLAFLFAGLSRWVANRWVRRILASAFAIVLLLCGPILGLLRAEAKIVPDNSYQLSVLAAVDRVTATTDPVYDNSGSYVFRPHVGFRYYTSALDRQVEAHDLTTRVSDGIRSSGCTAVLVDLRFWGLPAALKLFIASHFQPYSPDLWLWGQRYAAGVRTGTFDAVRDADYFLSPRTVATSGAFSIDGAPVTSQIFHLTRGIHQFFLADSTNDFQILWLPANRELYTPRYNGNPHFSVLF